jgi:hypothetical protein
VVVRYIDIGTDRPSLSPDLPKIELAPGEIADLIAFLKTLTGRNQTVSLPVLPY